MAVTVPLEVLKRMEREIERLQAELKRMKSGKEEGFETLETDDFLTEVYNG